MSSSLPTHNPTGYLGNNTLYSGNVYFRDVDPDNSRDVRNYKLGDVWINTLIPRIFMLAQLYNNPSPTTKTADWVDISASGGVTIDTMSGDGGVVVVPVANNVQIIGDAAQGITTNGIAPNIIQATIQDASLIQKGVAQFDPLFFSVAGGIVTYTGPGSLLWQAAVATPQAIAASEGWWTTLGGLTTFSLPNVCPDGTEITIQGASAGGWIITQNLNQQIIINSTQSSTLGVVGSVSSTDGYDAITLLCIVADTTWVATNIKGNLSVV